VNLAAVYGFTTWFIALLALFLPASIYIVAREVSREALILGDLRDF